jgi:hypothetical protein
MVAKRAVSSYQNKLRQLDRKNEKDKAWMPPTVMAMVEVNLRS